MGVQCIDCVREQRRQTPERRNALGTRLTQSSPIVTYVMIGLCLLVFAGQKILGSTVTEALWFVPVQSAGEPYRFLTSAFVHSPQNYAHILFNLYALWLVGRFLETALGHVRYLALYILSAVGGSTLVLLLSNSLQDWWTPVLGASGAVFGLFAAVLIILRRLGRDATQILIVIVLNVVIGFVVPGISWQGHFGGIIVGALLGAAFAWAPKDRRTMISWAAVIGVALLITVLSFTKLSTAGLV